MICERELKYLCDTFKRCRVPASVVSLSDTVDSIANFSVKSLSLDKDAAKATVGSLIGKLAPHTVYRYTDEYNLCYKYLSVADEQDSPILFIGPYLAEAVSTRQLFELGERLGASPKEQRQIENYFSNITVMREDEPVFLLLDVFCEHAWSDPSFATVDRNVSEGALVTPMRAFGQTDSLDFNVKAMEIRYKFENELMQAVTLGQLHKEKLIANAFSDEVFEKRVADPVRNAKNYSIIMNTLLRKAAERGGVHPVHIDRMSSAFALKIEKITSLSQNYALMREMFRSYCKLVRKHSMKNLSLTVQKTVLLIEGDLSTNLSLSTLAKQQNVSPSYLSALFKRETGKTVSEFIREKRIQYAENLLSTTHLQVQTVAIHCGIMDIQYFSKLFKRQTGKTPKEYREDIRLKNNAK